MKRHASKILILVAGMATGFAFGLGASSTHHAAFANPTNTVLDQLKADIRKNTVEITKLQRRIQSLSRKTTKLGGQVRGNRRATSVIATRSGIRIEFQDN